LGQRATKGRGAWWLGLATLGVLSVALVLVLDDGPGAGPGAGPGGDATDARAPVEGSGSSLDVEPLTPRTVLPEVLHTASRPLSARADQAPAAADPAPAEPVAADGPRLAVRVFDAGGAAVPQASLLAKVLGAEPEPLGVTDDEGRAELPLVRLVKPSHGTGYLIARHPAHGPVQRTVSGSDREVQITLPPGHELRVRVLAVGGGPVAGASVMVSAGLGPPGGFVPNAAMPVTLAQAPCDARGMVRLSGLPPQKVTLHASAPGHASAHESVEATAPTDDRPVVLRLRPTELLSVRVLDPSGAALSGAEVRVQVDGMATEQGRAVTDKEGRARFDQLPTARRRLDVSASHPTGLPATRTWEEDELAQALSDGEELVVKLGAAAMLRVSVADVPEPVAQQAVTVIAAAAESTGGGGGPSALRTMASGVLGETVVVPELPVDQLLDVALGTLAEVVHIERDVLLTAGESRELVLPWPGLVTVHVRAERGGEPLVLGSVRLTASDGREAIPSPGERWSEGRPPVLACDLADASDLAVPPGAYDVALTVDRIVARRTDLLLTDGTEVLFVLDDHLLTGRLVDGAGAPLPGETLRTSVTRITSLTDDAGRFRLQGTLRQAEDLQLVGEAFGAVVVAEGLPSGGELGDVAVALQQLSGQVILRDTGEPVAARLVVSPGVEDSPFPRSMRGFAGGDIQAGGDGRFRALLPAGAWMLRPKAPKLLGLPLDVDLDGPTEVTCELLATATLQVGLQEGAKGRYLVDLASPALGDDWASSFLLMPSGLRPHAVAAPPGTVEIRLRKGADVVETRSVVLVAGQKTEVWFGP
jgi:hypothetical protein